jgi:hypothetical protein
MSRCLELRTSVRADAVIGFDAIDPVRIKRGKTRSGTPLNACRLRAYDAAAAAAAAAVVNE